MISSVGNSMNISSSERLSEQIYRKMDLDRDGAVGKAEVEAFVIELTGSIFDSQANSESEGSEEKQSLSDFLASMNPYGSSSSMVNDLSALLLSPSGGASGSISPSASMSPSASISPDDLFESADKNGDGLIDSTELARFADAIMEESAVETEAGRTWKDALNSYKAQAGKISLDGLASTANITSLFG